jgi:hypothetical protein
MFQAIGAIFIFIGIWIFLFNTRQGAIPYLLGIGGFLLVIGLLISPASSRDLGQWENSDPAIRQWYKSLMQPDNPNVSCCGEADAYWCDDYYARDGKAYCKITDDRDDAPLGRPHIPIGTEIEIPPHKLKWDKANPTGHNIVFVNTYGHVWCFVQGGGV